MKVEDYLCIIFYSRKLKLDTILGILLNFIIIKLLYYVWCMMCDDWALYQELFMYLFTLTCWLFSMEHYRRTVYFRVDANIYYVCMSSIELKQVEKRFAVS
jgi:hypothetical protein